ncbi:unnamed protein product [Psylliodes chrysocephalus]|uniref:Glucose-methanol-choline oxidoreductase N-terminal domain-containing protein n=1 Tax=Psylliodes chrysocephalus TaxID=3402493 RepID=A0A9P0D0U9_9CUCU|nr:unnamed protein product [Psylliodes chrysocephala]
MYLVRKLIIFCYLINSFGANNVQEFVKYVTNEFKQIKIYQVSKNNEQLFSTCDAQFRYYGHFDFVIVGAGSAGAVLSNRLSEIKEWKILLLEAGGDLTKFSDVPAFSDYLQQTDMNWGYLTSSQKTCCQGMENNQCVYPQGKVIGGSSTLNSAIYSRGSPDDYAEWVNQGNPGWSFEEVLPYFKKSEFVALKNYDRPYHGTSGVLYVNQTSPPSVIAEAFLNANLEKGLSEVDYNGKKQLGVSRIQFNIKNNLHQNSAHAFLNPIRSTRKNFKLILNAAVNQLLINKNKVKGVTFVKDGVLYKATASKEVILSAGSINTPQLLLLSGIGPANELKKLRIPVLNNLPAVGKHLQDHPIFVNMYFRTNVTAPNHTLQDNLERYSQGMTPLTNGAGLEHLAFLNFKNETNHKAEIELITFAPPFSVPEDLKAAQNFKKRFRKIYEKYNTMTDISIIISLMKPKSEGAVTLRTNSILDFPSININYFSDLNNEDIETMYQGIKYALSLEQTAAFKKIGAHYIGEQPGCENLKSNDREYWYCALRHMTSTEYHPSSTTKMGPTPTDSVVDRNGLVYNMRNLRVVGASIVPTITRGHLFATVCMIAEKISDVIKKTHHKM